MLGLALGTVRLVPHESDWARSFAQEASRLAVALGKRATGIEHVGSTAVPGLEAKPILDIVVAVESLDGASALVPDLEALGYTRRPEGDLQSRLFLTKGPDDAVTHHLSLTEVGSPAWRDHVDFRDLLLSSEGIRREYQALKRRLALAHARERRHYTAKKSHFITQLLERARSVLDG